MRTQAPGRRMCGAHRFTKRTSIDKIAKRTSIYAAGAKRTSIYA